MRLDLPIAESASQNGGVRTKEPTDALTLAEARTLAETKLSEMGGELDYVVVSTLVFPMCWAFNWDSTKHQDSQSLDDALAWHSPIRVDRRDGSVRFWGNGGWTVAL
jgi:hypothetical protein